MAYRHKYWSLVQTLLVNSLKRGGNQSWDSLRAQLEDQDRLTVVLRRDDGKRYHIRKAIYPEPRQQVFYDALGIAHLPGTVEKTLIDPQTTVSKQM